MIDWKYDTEAENLSLCADGIAAMVNLQDRLQNMTSRVMINATEGQFNRRVCGLVGVIRCWTNNEMHKLPEEVIESCYEPHYALLRWTGRIL